MSNHFSLPPCCGTGCAVCVLDYAEEYAQAYGDAVPAAEAAVPSSAAAEAEPAPPLERVECCNSGCLVCVRDYPELCGQPASDACLPLLEAIEQAEQTAAAQKARTAG